jgi:hypothetical protein
MFEKRRQRLQELRKEAPQAQPETYGKKETGPSVSTADVNQIQPQYRGASQPRPEYQSSGQYLDPALDDKASPSR